ncbi:MAG: hypothetical protein LBO66_10675 [Deltaproteobacteria bacterium]|jgi:2'-5' RNA ligase|nr:hypothetical protein [Deltaproteobacteria bacterium]
MNSNSDPPSGASAETIRLYISLPLPPKFAEYFAALKEKAPELREASFANLHLALGFYERFPAREPPRALEKFAKLKWSAFAVRLRGPRAFPHKRTHWPAHLWVGVAPNYRLDALRVRLDAIARRVGRPPALGGKFIPHVGLARLGGAKPSAALARLLEDLSSRKFPSFRALSFDVIESVPRPAPAEPGRARRGRFALSPPGKVWARSESAAIPPRPAALSGPAPTVARRAPKENVPEAAAPEAPPEADGEKRAGSLARGAGQELSDGEGPQPKRVVEITAKSFRRRRPPLPKGPGDGGGEPGGGPREPPQA